MMKKSKIILLVLTLTALILNGCSGVQTVKNSEMDDIYEAENNNETIAKPVQTQTSIETETELSYYDYIEVYDNHVKKNLYEILDGRDCIVYFKREDCKDCIRDGESIHEAFDRVGLPVIEIETSKKPENFDGLSIYSGLVKGIGINEVPTVAFVKAGKFTKNLQNCFQDGTQAIDSMAAEIYQ